MSKSRLGSLLSSRMRISGAALLLFGVGIAIAWSLLPPPLPRVVSLGAGPPGGHYARIGGLLRERFAANRIDLQVVHTGGSVDNIRRLLAGELDIAFVQSGNLSPGQAAQLESVAAVLYEPVLLVSRSEWTSTHVEGGRIAIGAPGSGTHGLSLELLADQGVSPGVPPGTEFVEIGDQEALAALRADEVDSAIFVTSLEQPWVRDLFEDPDLRVMDFSLAEAFTRRYRYLRSLVIPAGLIDLKEEIPPRNVRLVATTASLVLRPGTHRGLIPLVIEICQDLFYQGGLLAAPEQFPSPHEVEAPLAPEARDYFERGPSLFYRWLPFRLAFAATRLMILLIPVLTLLYPLLRSAGPTYRWLMQRRIYRWYRVMSRLESAMERSVDPATREQLHKELIAVGDEIRRVRAPTRFAADLFHLRRHHQLLVERLQEDAYASAASGSEASARTSPR